MASHDKHPFSPEDSFILEPDNDPHQVPRGTVVLAATPIGNTGDASSRLRDLLSSADLIAAEDTRRLYDLANRLGVRVSGRVLACHDHNERQVADHILDQVEQGACALVVSDAGMPTINDPGMSIVRRAIDREIPVTCAPGPSAVLDALALSGLPTDRFCYEGFLPRRRGERLRHLRLLRNETRTMVFYETTHRIAQSMQDLQEVFGPDRMMALCRELTKIHEQVRRGTIADIIDSMIHDPPRGEMVLVVAGFRTDLIQEPDDEIPSEADLADMASQRARERGIKIKEAISQVVAEHPLPDGSLVSRKDIYAAAVARRNRN